MRFSAFMTDKAFEAVGEIGHATFYLCSLDADSADKQGHALPASAYIGLAEMDHRFELELSDRR